MSVFSGPEVPYPCSPCSSRVCRFLCHVAALHYQGQTLSVVGPGHNHHELNVIQTQVRGEEGCER